jgi:hypothetical protein
VFIMQTLPSYRRRFLMEPLEYRYFLTIVPIDATAGVPFEGLVATNLRLPDHATSLELINVMINGQWDYYPTAVPKGDGTFDLYAKMTIQRGGADEMTIWFRNNDTGGWDVLERGNQTIRDNHFSAVFPDSMIYNRVPGTQMRDAVATFTRTSLTRSLDRYVADVDWLGTKMTGRLVEQPDGTVAVFLDAAYHPLGWGGDVGVTIRMKDASAGDGPVGFSHSELSTGYFGGIGIGMFYGTFTDANGFRIELPKAPPYPGVGYHYFVPAAESDGFESTFTVELTWQLRDENITNTTGTVVRNADGSYSIIGQLPDVEFDNGMIRVRETVNRPAIGGEPAQTYTVEYVGSFNLADKLPPHIIPPPASEPPIDDGGDEAPIGGGGFEIDDMLEFSHGTDFGALTGSDPFAGESGGFLSILTNVLGSDDDSLIAGDASDGGAERLT